MNAEYYLIFMFCCARRAWGLLGEQKVVYILFYPLFYNFFLFAYCRLIPDVWTKINSGRYFICKYAHIPSG